MNREQKRMMARQGQVGADGTATSSRRTTAADVQRRRRERVGLKQFVKEIREEMRQVAWPTRPEVNNYTGGNPSLTPEKANTITAGFVFTPQAVVPRLSATIDYYHIKVNNAIIQLPETAATLRGIIERGPDAFYTGPVAEAIVAAGLDVLMDLCILKEHRTAMRAGLLT